MFNPYRQLVGLLPQPVLQYGTVTSTDGVNSVVTFPDTTTATVRGTRSVGTPVFVKDGRIDADAPTLTFAAVTE